jgi:hypothetical protein
VTEWQVWLADGTTRDSSRHTWEDVIREAAAAGYVLAVRWWGPRGNGVNWGDGLYGRPDTLVDAGMVSDEEFERVMCEVHATTRPPSARG